MLAPTIAQSTCIHVQLQGESKLWNLVLAPRMHVYILSSRAGPQSWHHICY